MLISNIYPTTTVLIVPQEQIFQILSPIPLQLSSYLSGSAGIGHSSFGSGSADCRKFLGSQTPFASSGGRVPLPDEKYQTGSESHSSSASLQVVP